MRIALVEEGLTKLAGPEERTVTGSPSLRECFLERERSQQRVQVRERLQRLEREPEAGMRVSGGREGDVAEMANGQGRRAGARAAASTRSCSKRPWSVTQHRGALDISYIRSTCQGFEIVKN